MGTVLLAVFLLAVSLVPLPFAAVRPWGFAPFAGVIGILVIAKLGLELATGRTNGLARIPVAATLFAVVCLWVLIQASPALSGWLAHPIWGLAADNLGLPLAATLSVDPAETEYNLFRLLAFGGTFYLAYRFGARSGRARAILIVLAATGTLYALYGLVLHLSGTETVLGMKKWYYVGDLTATFINRNSFATFAGLGTVICLALVLAGPRRSRRGPVDDDQAPPESRWRWSLLSRPAAGLALIVMFLAVVFTHSRAGLIATLVGMTTFLVGWSLIGGRWNRLPKAVPVVVLAGVLIIVGIAGDRTLGRMDRTAVDYQYREGKYEMILDAIASAPWTGYGAFERAFRMYRDQRFPTGAVEYAHNDYLQTLMELGVPVGLCLLAALGLLVLRCGKGAFVRQRDGEYPLAGLACTGVVGTHAFLDFSMQNPAVVVTYLTVLGVGVAQSWSSRSQAEEGTATGTVQSS